MFMYTEQWRIWSTACLVKIQTDDSISGPECSAKEAQYGRGEAVVVGLGFGACPPPFCGNDLY